MREGVVHPEAVPNAPIKARTTLTPKQTRWLKRLAWALVIYTVVGFLVVPAIIKWQLRKQLATHTHRAARVDAVRVNPYALSLGIRGLALTEPDGSTFASFSNFYVNFEAFSSLFRWTWTLKEIQLGSPYGYVAVLTNGQFNFANMLTNAPATNAPAPTSKPPPPLFVKSLVITNGVVAVADFYRALPFRTQFAPIEVRLTNFTTRPRKDSPYEFTASTGEGEFFNWAGDLSAVPPASAGKFELGGIDLKKYATYVREFTQLDVRDGKVTVGAAYQFALSTNGIDLAVTNGSVLLTNLQVFALEASNALVSIPSASVRGASADLRKRAAKVASVETTGGSILARRFRDGTLELLQLAAPPTNRAFSILNPPITITNAPVAPVPPAAPWSVLVEGITVKDYAVRVNDEQPPTPANLIADQIELAVKGFSLASNAPVSVQFATRVNQTGAVKLNSEGTLLPLALDSSLEVNAIDLRPFQPYVEQQQVKLAFTSGNVSTTGRASLALAGTNPPAVKFAGDVVLNNIAVVDQIAFQDFARWKQVAVRGIDFVLAPMSVKVRELACDELVTSVVVSSNKQLTALAVLPAKTNAPAAPAPPVPVSSAKTPETLLPFPLQLDLLALTNVSIRFVDLSLQPNCRFAIEQFSGTVRGLSSALNTAADVDISGRVNEAAPFSVTGKINPLLRDLLVDLVISNRNTELTAFTPYMEKFAGHPLQKGKLTVGLKYQVKQQALEAQNVVFIDQLTLGQRNNSPDAIKLPVKLGVALLKDRNGRIELDVPVKGRLDDPKFAIGPIIWHVVENLLIKAATSPFTLLGALVGGGEELSFIEFAPGQSAISDAEMAKTEKLGKALYERPALSLEMTGSVDETLDASALAWMKLERELKSARMAELAGKSDAPAAVDEILLSPREYERLLKAHYKKTFNRDRPLPVLITNAVTGVVTNARPAIARSETFKGGASLMLRDGLKTPVKTTNAPVTAAMPVVFTRPASMPAIAADDEVLAQMEMELHAGTEVTPDDLRALMQARAQSVQRALLKTGKVEAERLFILTPKPAEAGARDQPRVILSLS
jgi:hypothetical protein